MDQSIWYAEDPLMRSCHQVTRQAKRDALRIHHGVSQPLSSTATARLWALDWHRRQGENVSRTCRHFGISRPTFYRWQRRYKPHRLETLENRSHRPIQVRHRTWGQREVEVVVQLRNQYPCWGKAKLAHVLVRDQDVRLSVSMVGRILSYARRRKLLQAPVRAQRTRRRQGVRPYAVRKPRAYQPSVPGDLVQVDTMDVRPSSSAATLTHLSLIDVVSRYAALEIRGQTTARTSAENLTRMLARLPFPIRAIQVDGGSEFMAEFEELCQVKEIPLYVLPPRSPKLNGHVERSQRTHATEFYDVTTADPSVVGYAPALADYECIYNIVRPHQALGYRTPAQFLQEVASSCTQV